MRSQHLLLNTLNARKTSLSRFEVRKTSILMESQQNISHDSMVRSNSKSGKGMELIDLRANETMSVTDKYEVDHIFYTTTDIQEFLSMLHHIP